MDFRPVDGYTHLMTRRRRWRSIKSEHTQEYAKNQNIQEGDLLVGVVVQAMIDSEVAGVMFTVNPVTGNKNELIIDGSFGLGEAVVHGIVTPDSFLVNKRSVSVSNMIFILKTRWLHTNTA